MLERELELPAFTWPRAGGAKKNADRLPGTTCTLVRGPLVVLAVTYPQTVEKDGIIGALWARLWTTGRETSAFVAIRYGSVRVAAKRPHLVAGARRGMGVSFAQGEGHEEPFGAFSTEGADV